MKNLRKINRILSALLVVLIVLHGILGSFQLLGIGSHAGVTLAWIGFGLLLVHAGIGFILTARTIRTEHRSKGRWYLRANAGFWIRRLTGAAILFLVFFHLGMFSATVDGEFVLLPFSTVKLAAMLALVLTVFLHIFENLRPLLISLGILTDRERRIDILVFLSVILVFISVSVVLYYLSWWI